MSIGRGWSAIEADLRRELAALGITLVSVYEKYGTLRCNATPWTEQVQAACDRAEELSTTVCENCGRPGKLRSERPWIKTLCDVCPGVESSRREEQR